MFTEKEFALLTKMNFSFKLSPTGRYANIYKKDKFLGSIYDTKNSIYFMGKDYFETSGKELIEYLANASSELLVEPQLSNDEVFRIWKRSVLEKKPANYYDQEFGKGRSYMFHAFGRLGLPASTQEIANFNKNILSSLLKQNYYIDAKTILNSFSK